jgi:YidC/Oxa1 family membrane protein insertase
MFTTIIIQPIFNLLVLIYALIPGHNFGLAIIIFTIIIRLLLWPLVKKQLSQAKAMRDLAPELKKIKKAAAGDKRKASMMTMELYKEREINPFASIGILIVQLPILIGLYSGLRRIIQNPHQIIDFSYPALHHLGWMQHLAGNIHNFDNSLFGIVDLSRKATGAGGIYWPAMVIVIASAFVQYYQSKQLMPRDKDARGLRTILRDAGSGKTADQQEVNAAVTRGTQYMIPAFVFLFGLSFAAALPLYWLASSSVAFLQQARVLKEDTTEAEASVKLPDNSDKPQRSTRKPENTATRKQHKKRKRR